ncbi:hypothetical protein C8K44_1571, partial [Aminobacter sp. AP02]
AKGSLATVSWYLMERACFSDISACNRSPTILSDENHPLNRVLIP